jgi:hypothetical protein
MPFRDALVCGREVRKIPATKVEVTSKTALPAAADSGSAANRRIRKIEKAMAISAES